MSRRACAAPFSNTTYCKCASYCFLLTLHSNKKSFFGPSNYSEIQIFTLLSFYVTQISSHSLCVFFSKPLMDLLVTLCATYHLNPSSHTLELVTANRNNIKLKPNALIGTLDAEKIILKPKGEDKNKKTGPQVPEVH